MNKTSLVVSGILIIALTIIVVAVKTERRPSGPVPDLDAEMIETAKHLHPPKLTP